MAPITRVICATPKITIITFIILIFCHFFPLYLDSERNTGKDLEILPKSFIFAARMKTDFGKLNFDRL